MVFVRLFKSEKINSFLYEKDGEVCCNVIYDKLLKKGGNYARYHS